MTELPVLPANQLKVVVTDAQELAKGVGIADKGGLKHLARHANKLYAEADGSGSAPYKTQIVHDDKGWRGRCSCMAARSRPFCKHAAALLVLWTRDQSAFAQAEAPADTSPAEGVAAVRSKPKTGKVDAHAMMRQGVEQTLALVRELALSGLSTVSRERVAQIRALAETLRAERLRRMSARLLELAQILDLAVLDYGLLDSEDYAASLADLSLSARRVQKHLDGVEPLNPEHVETLIGKTWTKKDRNPVGPLDLVEYAFLQQLTADDFVIRESRFLDLASGVHYSEKQIVPGFLAKRSAPKRSYEGCLLRGAMGGRYPGFAPFRLELWETPDSAELDQAALAQIEHSALTSVAAALTVLLDARKDPFAADSVPVAIRLQTLYAEGERLFAVDAGGDSLWLGDGPGMAMALSGALTQASLRLVLGDLLLVGAMPTLSALALLIERDGALELVALPAVSAETLLHARKRKSAPATGAKRERWVETGRMLGVSAAALALGEVREELTDLLAEGLSALHPRRVEAAVQRLQGLNLVKPAALLAEVAQRPDPADKLDDLLRILKVLDIGLTRLAASKKVDRSRVVRSPLLPAVEVLAPEVALDPEGLLAELGSSRLQGHGRAVAIDRALSGFDAATLARLAPMLFGDGSVSVLVATRYASHPDLALQLAAAALRSTGLKHRQWSYEAECADQARIGKLTAILLLKQLGTPAALTLLREFAERQRPDPALKAMALWSLHPTRTPALQEQWLEGLKAGNRDDRLAALRRIGQNGAIAALPQVRLLAANDPSVPVRHTAWSTLALLLDVGIVPPLIGILANRANDQDGAREAAFSLGLLGDNRAIGPLLDAFADGFKPATIADSLRALGVAILPALLDRVEAQPALAERKVAQEVLIAVGAETSKHLMAGRLAAASAAQLAARAPCYLKLASGPGPLKVWMADAIEARAAVLGADFTMPVELKRALARTRTPARKPGLEPRSASR